MIKVLIFLLIMIINSVGIYFNIININLGWGIIIFSFILTLLGILSEHSQSKDKEIIN